MHTSGDPTANSVPAFLTKLWTLVDDPGTNELICWDNGGRSFHVLDQSRFAKEMLPLYFKHNNMASFIRQLNMYGFRKVVRTEPIYLKSEKDDVEFAHQYFVQGQESLLEFIKRKVSGVTKVLEETHKRDKYGGQISEAVSSEDDLHRVLVEVNYMKNKQDSMTSKLDNLKIENEMLWREVATLRQQHNNQSQVVKKLISFLLSLLGNQRTTLGGMKRKLPLMLEAGSSSSSNDIISPPKISRRSANVLPATREYRIQTPLQSDGGGKRDDKFSIEEVFEGAVPLADSPITTTSAALPDQHASTISDLKLEPLALLTDEDIGSNVELRDLFDQPDSEEIFYEAADPVVSSDQLESALLPANVTSHPLRQFISTSKVPAASATAGLGSSSGSGKSLVSQKPQSSKVTTLALADPSLPGDFDKADMTLQLDTLQANLDAIKEIFAHGQYNIDSNTLFGIYDLSSIPGLYEEISDPSSLVSQSENKEEENNEAYGGIQGNEVIQYMGNDDLQNLFQDIGDLNTPYPSTLDEPLYPELSLSEALSPVSSMLVNPLTLTTASESPATTTVNQTGVWNQPSRK